MNEEDKKRLHRKVKLSIYDLERIRGAVRDQMTFYFKAGVEDQYEYLKSLDKMLKESIENPLPAHKCKEVKKCERIEVKKFERIPVAFAHNWAALILINDKLYTAVRQGGGLNFWAFSDRTKFSLEDQKYIDEILDEELAEERRLLGEIA